MDLLCVFGAGATGFETGFLEGFVAGSSVAISLAALGKVADFFWGNACSTGALADGELEAVRVAAVSGDLGRKLEKKSSETMLAITLGFCSQSRYFHIKKTPTGANTTKLATVAQTWAYQGKSGVGAGAEAGIEGGGVGAALKGEGGGIEPESNGEGGGVGGGGVWDISDFSIRAQRNPYNLCATFK